MFSAKTNSIRPGDSIYQLLPYHGRYPGCLDTGLKSKSSRTQKIARFVSLAETADYRATATTQAYSHTYHTLT